MEKIVRMALLLDFYCQLLTEKQRRALELHYSHDLSLGEIAAELEISRPAVHDIIKRSEAILEEYEAKLGLVARYLERRRRARELAEAFVRVKGSLPPWARDELGRAVAAMTED